MVTRGQLRHHTAVGPMQGDLAEQPVRQQARGGVVHRHGGLVTGGFDAQYPHVYTFTINRLTLNLGCPSSCPPAPAWASSAGTFELILPFRSPAFRMRGPVAACVAVFAQS